jgi:hypothetical protein
VAWLATGIAKMTPAETAAAMANDLMLNTIRSSFLLKSNYALMTDTRHPAQITSGERDPFRGPFPPRNNLCQGKVGLMIRDSEKKAIKLRKIKWLGN